MATLDVRMLSENDVPLDVRLHHGDHVEVSALGMSDYEAVMRAVQMSEEAWSVRVDGVPCVFGGYASRSMLGSSYHVWMLGTDAASAHPVALYRIARRVLSVLHEQRAHVFVTVDGEYASALRWARLLGFTKCNHFGRWVELCAVRKDN